MSSVKNPGNVIGGHKANINNPNTSGQSKEHSREVIDEIKGGNLDPTTSGGSDYATDGSGKEINRVLGGLKAAVNNPNTSQEAKQRAKAELAEHDIEIQ